ncbi:MAG: MMPL family protein, partial [Desulfobulbaceae bacterium]|nr:MMPL family protein [Desulfobulbaceae bacterium]
MTIRLPVLLLSLIVAAVFLGFGLLRLDIDTDIVRSLPSGERVIGDGLDIFEHHPIHDQIAIDIGIEKSDPDTLLAIGSDLEKRLVKSGLFSQVGTDEIGALIPDLALNLLPRLPLLFSKEELENNVAPLVEPGSIEKRIEKLYTDLSSMQGIGQAGFIGTDPLGLKDLILAKLAPLSPSSKAQFYRGSLLSADGKHLLITAKPLVAGTDTASARRISELIDEISQELVRKFSSTGQEITLTPVGAYRAALDNERIIRHDVQLALVLVTVGIGLLLLFSFPRPLIGLLSLLPALAGTGTALFVYSLLHPSISI